MSRSVPAAFAAALFTSLALGQTYTNGPLVTHPAGGFMGADASALEPNLNTLGFGSSGSTTANQRLADDFTVPCGETWTLGSIKVYAYQASAPRGGAFPALR